MIFLVILLVIIIVWLQLPQYNIDKDERQEIKIFNFIKTPVIVICFILIIFSTLVCVEKPLEAYTSIPKY